MFSIMSNMKRTSKRKKRVPNKFDNTICDLNNKKVDDGSRVCTEDCSGDGSQTDKPKETVEVEENIQEADKQDTSPCSKSALNREGDIRDESVRKEEKQVDDGMLDKEEQLKNNKAQFSSYVKATLAKNNDINRSLFEKPTEIDEDGNEYVVFDETIISEGCKRMCNIPLETWTKSGISALASRLGKPLVMDTITAEICKKGVGRVKYARVLVEVPANKNVHEEIEVVYRDKDRVELCRKKISVKFDWILLRCSKCCVFWHDLSSCGKADQGKTNAVNLEEANNQEKKKGNDANGTSNDGFIKVRNKKEYGGGKKQQSKPSVQTYKLVQKQGGPIASEKSMNQFSVQDSILDALRRYANIFVVLDNLEIDKQNGDSMGSNPIDIESGEVNDVFRDENGIAQGMENDIIEGIDRGVVVDGQDFRNFLRDEKLSVCAIIETRIKAKKLLKIRDGIFKQWEWINNMRYCDKGCMIIMGWNIDNINLKMLHYCKQSVLCRIEDRRGKLLMFYTIVYAANGGNERRDLWKDLSLYKGIVADDPWAIMGDMNVTLDPSEHFTGSSSMSKDIQEFKDCVNLIEIEDIASSGLFYTWTKICTSEYPQAHFIFLPYLISDHYPVVLSLPNTIQGRKKSFRLRDKLKSVQQRIDVEPHNKLLREEESVVLGNYEEAMREEEKLYSRNRVNAIHDERGNRFEGNKVVEQFVKHFKQFLGESSPVNYLQGCNELFKKKSCNVDAEYMVREVSNAEIKKAMFMIDDNKAPGPDGYTSHFFKKAWNVVGNAVCKVVREFFDTGRILSEINSTIIAFECLVLAERLKKYLGKLVSQNQSAFIPNRQIQDNILISQELLKRYNKKNRPKRVALKIDLQKAYDTVNCNFLEDILNGFGFHRKMVNWIMKCVTSTSFLIAVNGESCGFFKGGLGLRQGDPIYPYLFTLVMEILNLLMIRRIENNDSKSVKIIKDVIDEFGDVSGLLPNYNKSTIIFGSINDEVRQEILDVIPFRVEKLSVKYLGVPLITKRTGVKECKSLVDKVRNRILSWKNKILSYAGRLQLVASVLESIQVYWANVFLLPQTVIEEINKLLKGFLWNQSDHANGKAKVVWKNLSDKDTLWVKWINTFKLMGRTVWEVNEDSNDSWGWRNILRMRLEARMHMIMKVGNGERTSLWFDNWSRLGPLSEIISYRDVYDARMESNLTLNVFCNKYKGHWPEEWSTLFPMVTQLPNIKLSHEKCDVLMWKRNDGILKKFTIRNAYQDLQSRQKNIMVNKKIELRINERYWESTISKLADMKNRNNIGSVERKLCLAASVYLIWQERNNRLFKNEKRSVDELFTVLVNTIQLRLCNLNVIRSQAVCNAEVRWNVKLKSPKA
ncbi:RNA-directed DNA polymerase, eukaryota, reverse transcriptase zinc-binding domain protein [Tanacetum coccineum]